MRNNMNLKNYVSYGEPVKQWTLLHCIDDDLEADVHRDDWVLMFSLFLDRNNTVPTFSLPDLPIPEPGDDKMIDRYLKKLIELERRMKVEPQTGYSFYSACLNDGFEPENMDYYQWLGMRINSRIISAYNSMSISDLKRTEKMFVSVESYEKAARIRDLITKKKTAPEKKN